MYFKSMAKVNKHLNLNAMLLICIISIEIKNQVLKWFIFTWASIVLVPIVKDISEEYCLTAKVTADYNKDQWYSQPTVVHDINPAIVSCLVYISSKKISKLWISEHRQMIWRSKKYILYTILKNLKTKSIEKKFSRSSPFIFFKLWFYSSLKANNLVLLSLLSGFFVHIQ